MKWQVRASLHVGVCDAMRCDAMRCNIMQSNVKYCAEQRAFKKSWAADGQDENRLQLNFFKFIVLSWETR